MAVTDGKIRCSTCREQKPTEAYQRSVVLKGCGQCRTCKHSAKRRNQAADRERYNATVRRQRAARGDGHRAYQRAYLDKNPRKAKCFALRQRYGIRLEDYEQMLADQSGGCAICGKMDNGDGRFLYVDHCHATGKVRGLLCHNCNSGIGHFRDNVALMHKAIDYVNRSQDNG